MQGFILMPYFAAYAGFLKIIVNTVVGYKVKCFAFL